MMIKRTSALGQYLLLLILSTTFAHAQVAGTKLNITTSKSSYILGEPIWVNITFASSEDIFFYKPLEDNLRCVITDIHGKKRISRGFKLHIERWLTEADFLKLAAGSSHQAQKNIIYEYFSDAEVGRFKIKFIFDTLKEPLPKEVEGKLAGYGESNEIEIIIKEPIGQDLSAFQLMASRTKGDKVNNFFDRVLAENVRDELIKKYPDSVYTSYALYYQGIFYYRIGSRVGNEEYLKKAIQSYKHLLNSYHDFDLIPEARLGISNAYLALKQYDMAIQEAQKIIQEYPDTFAAQESKELLDRIDAIKR